MITLQEVEVYKKYLGDIEALDRFGKKKDRAVLQYKEAVLIDRFVQDFEIIFKGLASKEFEKEVINRIRESCVDQITIDSIKAIAQNNVKK